MHYRELNIIVSTGYAMAKNLRAKIPASDTLIIRDVNENTAKRFVEENQEAVRNSGAKEDTSKVLIAQNAREVAEQSVSYALRFIIPPPPREQFMPQGSAQTLVKRSLHYGLESAIYTHSWTRVLALAKGTKKEEKKGIGII